MWIILVAANRACLISCGLGCVGCAWLHAATYRTKLRGLFSLPEEPYSDSVVHCCCCLCALSQEYRELKNRDVDPSIGIFLTNSPPHSYFVRKLQFHFNCIRLAIYFFVCTHIKFGWIKKKERKKKYANFIFQLIWQFAIIFY